MLDRINPIYNINCSQKTSGVYASLSEPVSHPINKEVNFRGSDALASYNNAGIKQNEKFNIPDIDPIIPLDKMNEIKGERIYNSDGKIVEIVDEGERYKTTYTPSDANESVFDAEVWDKETQDCVKSQNFYHSTDGNTYLYIREKNNGLCTENFYKYYDGQLTLHHKSKELSGGNTMNYSCEKEEYSTCKGNTRIIYDKNKNLKQVTDYDEKNKSNLRTNFFNNKPVSTETRTYNSIPETFKDVDPFNDPDLRACDYYEIGDTQNVEGEKFYYSNGKLEKIVTPEGKIYSYDLNGKIESLKDGNKTIYSNQGHQEIQEDLGNGNTRTTSFHKNKQPSFVEYSNGNAYKHIGRSPDNSIYYQQCDDGYTVYSTEYDDDKNVTSSQVWYHDDCEE